ncbi:MAG: HD domain-containing protein [Candidatus Caenarcaniphilales bacterium]|nr:HD domain-containing protein [Candidatus Caenarcaniphilales bacterium]
MPKSKKYSFLDPIHGSIELDTGVSEDKLILDLIETPEFQRLRRIRQLGFSYMTFYGAESSRFVHSIGTCEIARKILNHLSSLGNEVEEHRACLLASALLHDVGHGPFSHSSEPSFNFEHEDWTIKNILGKTSINQVLSSYHSRLPSQVAEVLQEKYAPSWVSRLVSSQLDCDRADYLLRDSFQTGTKYGVFQLDRIIRSLELVHTSKKQELVITEKGLNAVEDYLFARYSMYLQVYHHRKTLSADALFCGLISRARDLVEAGQKLPLDDSLKKWLLDPKEPDTKNKMSNKMTLSDFWQVDDSTVLHHLKLWSVDSKDGILKDLSQRLLNRRLFKTVKLQNLKLTQLKKIVSKIGSERTKYYCMVKECREFPYQDRKKPILVRDNGKVVELSKASTIAKTLMNKDKELDVEWVFFPAEYQ